ncbi:MAG TPA: hypothetical protein ENK26_03245 [Gammaproteobacteria bacterium]|nr:hypothetical protein [Gammaproteobacteria bacterium]
MNKQPDPERIDEENPEWTDAMFKQARRGAAATKRGPGRPAGSNKVSTTIRFDKEVIDAFKQDGPGWQSHMNNVLLNYIKKRGHSGTADVHDSET